MSEKYPAYLWYPKDVLSSGRVSMLTDLEELWYRRALDQSWLGDGIPGDPAEFAGWVGRGCTTEAAEKIISRFFVPHKKDPSKVVNLRQEIERTNLKKKSKVRSEAGRLSGVKRREKRDLTAEQMFNKNGTKPNIPIAIAIEEKEVRKEEEKRPPQAASTPRGTRLPEPFNLSKEMSDWAAEKRPSVDAVLETEKFVNYWRAKSGRDATKLDWRATWNNWILNAKESGNGTAQKYNRNGSKPTPAETILSRSYYSDLEN